MADEKKVSNRLSREEGTGDTYNKLLGRLGPLNKENRRYSRDIFALSMAFGYLNDIKMPISSKDNFLNKTNMGKNLPALITSLAITKSDDGIEVLAKDSSEIYDVAEQYANGGLEILNSEYVGNETEFIEKLRIHILKLNKNDRILKKLEELEL